MADMCGQDVTNEGLTYTTIDGFIEWISENFAGILSNDKPNNYSPSTLPALRVIKRALLYAEGKVNGFLKKRYKVPVSPDYPESISVIEMYVWNIATYELFGRRGITKERYYKYTRTLDDLKSLSQGLEDLPNCKTPLRTGTDGKKLSYGHTHPSVFSNSKRRYADSI